MSPTHCLIIITLDASNKITLSGMLKAWLDTDDFAFA